MQDEIYMKKYFFIKIQYLYLILILPKDLIIQTLTINFITIIKKILIMGDLNQSEIYEGIIKLTKLKYFLKFEKKLSFVVKGNYNYRLKDKLKKKYLLILSFRKYG